MFTQAIDVLLQIHCQIFEYQVETSIRKNNITKPSIQKRRSVAVPIRRSRLTEQCFDGEVLSRWIFHEWQLREHHHLLLLIESSSMRRSVTLADDRLCRQCHMYLRWTRVREEWTRDQHLTFSHFTQSLKIIDVELRRHVVSSVWNKRRLFFFFLSNTYEPN